MRERMGANGAFARYREGVAASLIAETVFVAMVFLVSLLRAKDPWRVTRMPGSFLLGPEAVQPPGFVAGDVTLGILVHVWIAVLVGILFAFSLPRLRIGPIVGGMITAGLLYAVGFWLLPRVFPDWLAPFWLHPMGRVLQAGAHLVYGLVFGVVFRGLTGQPRAN